MMDFHRASRRTAKHAVKGAILASIIFIGSWGRLQGQSPGPEDFVQANVQGFGDRQNSWAWAMQWWRGKLYVGTNRSWGCVQIRSVNLGNPVLFPYPPRDPDIECTQDPDDLPLQAEIWRYTPQTQTWERVYQSPNDVAIPEHPGKYTARDFGYRDMAVFREPNGTEALYVSGVSTRSIHPGVPPPRLLRSTDGVAFAPISQAPGTVLGDLDADGFRSLVVYKDHLYVVAGTLFGDGVLLEAANPAEGNNAFRQVTPDGMRMFEMAVFAGQLYLGLHDRETGYAVVKTDTAGVPPYTFSPVVTQGGFRQVASSKTVLSMAVFRGQLYVGTDRPAELLRINPDDTWDLIMGAGRDTPQGHKEPLSGMGDGFDQPFNGHVWRMEQYGDQLFVGTADFSTMFRNVPYLGDVLRPHLGFDLFATGDGVHFTAVTRTGFGDPFDYGVRTFASTPYGLFLGTANEYYGTKIWQRLAGERYSTYLPLLQAGRQ